MNYIHSFYSVFNTDFSALKNQFLSVTIQQAKVVLIASVIFGLLATCCYAVCCCLKQRKMKNHLKEVPSTVKLMALSFLDAKDRESFMQVNHDSAHHVRRLPNPEKQAAIHYLQTLSNTLDSNRYRDELASLNELITEPIFNRPSVSFQEYQMFLNEKIYHIFRNKISNPAFSDLTNNKTLMLCLVKANGLLLRHASFNLEGDSELFEVAVRQNEEAAKYGSSLLRAFHLELKIQEQDRIYAEFRSRSLWSIMFR